MTNDLRERVAQLVYDRGMLYLRTELPAWTPGGNSLAQDEARMVAAMILDDAQAELQAAVAAERWACAGAVYEHALKNGSKIPATYNRILHRTTDADAQAALDRVKREARNEALREALALSWLCFHKCNDEIDVVTTDDILELMEDTDDE